MPPLSHPLTSTDKDNYRYSCFGSGCMTGHTTAAVLLENDNLLYVTNYKGPNQLFKRDAMAPSGWVEMDRDSSCNREHPVRDAIVEPCIATHPLLSDTVTDGSKAEWEKNDHSTGAIVIDPPRDWDSHELFMGPQKYSRGMQLRRG